MQKNKKSVSVTLQHSTLKSTEYNTTTGKQVLALVKRQEELLTGGGRESK